MDNNPQQDAKKDWVDDEPLSELAPWGAESPESLPPSGGPENAGDPAFEVKIVRDWDADTFHQRVLDLESQGYISRRETHRITPDTNPETGEVLHLNSIELVKPKSK